MKKIFALMLLCLFTTFQAQAVLKEKDLPQTLGVLRAELERSYKEQKALMARFERRNGEQHANLIRMMQNSNQIALMLYSQNSDFTFDMAYACQAATEQYRSMKSRHMPYNKMKERIKSEIERYEALIKALQAQKDSIISTMKANEKKVNDYEEALSKSKAALKTTTTDSGTVSIQVEKA